MKYGRYMVFWWDDYDSEGGLRDVDFHCDDLSDLRDAFKNNKYLSKYNVEIFDRVEGVEINLSEVMNG